MVLVCIVAPSPTPTNKYTHTLFMNMMVIRKSDIVQFIEGLVYVVLIY